ncbi:MAG: hypothetical protein ACT4N1_00295 [Nitrososphaerota archaeon]
MTSLSRLARSYKNKKIQATKLRRQTEKKLKTALSLKRRSSSGLSSLERRKEAMIAKKDEISQLLSQYLAQRASIQRLKTAAEERIMQEKEAKERAQQESEFVESPDDKARAFERVKTIDQKIAELNSEIRQRNAAEERLVKLIADTTKAKSRLDLKIRQQVQSKPALLVQLKSSTKSGERLRSQVQTKLKQEAQLSRNLVTINEKLKLLKAKRRKAKRKARKKTKRKVLKLRRKAKARKTKTRTKKALKRRTKTRKRRTIKRKAKRKATKKSRKSKRR